MISGKSSVLSIFVILGGWLILCPATRAENIEMRELIQNIDNYEINLSYPVLNERVIPTAKLINLHFLENLISDGCIQDDESESSIGYYYDASSHVEAITKSFVTFRTQYSVFCGGAHPSHGISFKVFDAVTGNLIDLASEVPVQDYSASEFDYDQYEEFQRKLAELILRFLEPEADVHDTCPDTITSVGEIVSTYSPRLVATGEDETAIILTYPPHVIAVCQFYVSVPFKEVRRFFPNNSIIHHRLD